MASLPSYNAYPHHLFIWRIFTEHFLCAWLCGEDNSSEQCRCQHCLRGASSLTDATLCSKSGKQEDLSRRSLRRISEQNVVCSHWKLVKDSGVYPRQSDCVGLGWHLRVCISNMLPHHPNTVHQWTTLRITELEQEIQGFLLKIISPDIPQVRDTFLTPDIYINQSTEWYLKPPRKKFWLRGKRGPGQGSLSSWGLYAPPLIIQSQTVFFELCFKSWWQLCKITRASLEGYTSKIPPTWPSLASPN